ncbi:MAG: hypothetical protein Tsb0034_10550 [Ekhidna sp.]
MNKILLGSERFKAQLEQVAAEARDSLLVQAMTFEGDDAGEWLIETMMQSPAKDKRLLIDSYSKVVVNDHFVISGKYLSDKAFRDEVKNTKAVLEKARTAGIAYKFVNPVGFLGQKYPLRNHKKMVVVDGVYSYLGGINFSDHNFAWHDMMIELTDEKVGKILVDDFNQTWNGINQSKVAKVGNGELYFFNGRKSQSLYEHLFQHLRDATERIDIISPYISEPLLSVVKEISKKGVGVTVISPSKNNKSIFRNLILSEYQKGYFKLKEFEGMSHMKAILIDNNKLIFGSSNYDLISYYFEQEVVMMLQDKSLVEQFQELVLKKVKDINVNEISGHSSSKAAMLMKLLDGFGRMASSSFLKTV